MVVNFSNIDFSERPILILKNASDTPLGVLGYAKNVAVDLKYNETSSIEFEVPGFVNGEETPFYNDIAGMRTLEVQGIGQFTLISPSENGDGVQKVKSCKGYSLEYEFVYKKITLPENTYKFWDEVDPSGTLLGMIMELMPSWSIGSVSSSLLNKYRTFEVNNENLYNLIKGTVQRAYNCIFDFDTMNRKVYVRDASDTPESKPVFLSLSNLAKEIEVTENTEDIFTRLDVNGAEGVTIRDVNPTGTNKIINLDYYMTEDNFPSELIEKYYAWKQLYADNKLPYYSLSVQYAVKTAQMITERAKLTDFQGEMTSLENLQAVAIQSIAQGIGVQGDLDKANADIAIKQGEINAKQVEIDALQNELSSIFNQLKAITETCSFENYFTDYEYRLLDRYIKDGEISESSFVVAEVSSYESEGNGKRVGSISVSFSNCTITHITTAGGSRMYDIRGGEIEILGDLKANVVSAIVEQQSNGAFVATAYLSSGTIAGNSFQSACVSLTGDGGSITSDTTSAIVSITNGYRYFTLDASEYEKRSVAWDLYEFGEEILNKMAAPSYSFSITSANFLALEEFVTFKNALTLGEKVYVDMGDRGILQPIAIGVKFTYDDPESMDLLFADTYTSGDSTFRLIDLLEQSISMGKNVEMSKYIYSSFVDSGASTGLKEFMTSALDVAKNAIMSSTNQAISWDGAGFRLRKWTNESHTAYDPEQIWMNNNSIVMTDDNWATAQMAIGKFHDENLGDCWGIVAPRIVGTLLAGGSLVIESAKRDGDTAVFRVDGDGCRLYNADFNISKTNAFGKTNRISISPTSGIVIGVEDTNSALFNSDGTVNEAAGRMWVDMNGNMHMKGAIVATSLHIQNSSSATAIDIADYVVSTAFGSDEYGTLLTRVTTVEQEVTADSIVSKVTASSAYTGLVNSVNSVSKRLTTAEQKITDDAIISTVTSSATYQGLTQTVSDLGNDVSTFTGDLGNLTSRMESAEQKITPNAIVSTVTQSDEFKQVSSGVSSLNSDLANLTSRVNTAEQKITPNAIISTVTSSQSFTDLSTRLYQAEQKITADAIIATVTSSATYTDLTKRVSSAEQKITADAIMLTVSSSSSYQSLQGAADNYNKGLLTNASVTIDTNGVSLKGGAIAIAAGTKVTIDAEHDDSYIRFGGTSENPNFLLGKQGTVKAASGHFGSITVDDMSIMQAVPGSLCSKLFVGSSKPASGSGYVWIHPSSVSSIDFVTHPTEAIYMNGTNPTKTLQFTHSGEGLLGDTCKYGVQLRIYNYSGNAKTTYMTVKIKRSNGTGNTITIVNNVSVGYVGVGDYFTIDTLDAPTALLENITDTEAIDVIVTLSKTDTSSARFEYGDFVLRCTSNSSASEQACNVVYVA